MIGIDADWDYLLDPQQARPAGDCAACGAEVWRQGEEFCTRCRLALFGEDEYVM